MSDKNFADVASDGIDKLSSGIGSITDKVSAAAETVAGSIAAAAKEVSKAAPELWRMAVREKFTEGILDLCVSFAIVCMVTILNVALIPAFVTQADFRSFLHVVTLVLGPLVAIGYAYAGAHKALNAEYYAAAKLLKEAKDLR